MAFVDVREPGRRIASGRAVEADPLTACQIAIIVPTRNEAGNIAELLRRLDAGLGGVSAEIIFVDDSSDETPDVVRREAEQTRRVVRMLHREEGSRSGGLSGAVMEGFALARARWVVVMDGDVQHPPEMVPSLVAKGEATNADIVVASRYLADGDACGLSNHTRVAVSSIATRLARTVFPRTLRTVSDPLSGFFAVRATALERGDLRPHGFKILLEILVRSPTLRVVSVPFSFGARFSGGSKASLAEGARFARHLVRLRLSATPRSVQLTRATAFGVVGLTGTAVNVGLLWLFVSGWGLHYLWGAALATQGSTLWNFVWTDRAVYRGPKRRRLFDRLVRFWVLNNVVMLARLPVLAFLVAVVGVHYLIANLVTLVLVFLARFVVSDRIIFSKGER